jgi:hypothetical protein
MRSLLSVLAVGLFVLVAAPQNALACHKGDPGIPHGNQTSCDGLPPLSGDQDVFVTMNDGDMVTLATSGSLEVFAVCTVTPATGSAAGQIFVTSSEEGWWQMTRQTPRASGEEVMIFDGGEGVGGGYQKSVDLNAVTPNGFHIRSDNLGVGFNMFDPGCLVIGRFVTAQAP